MLRHRWPRWLAIVVSVIGTLAIVTGLLWLAVWQITREWGAVRDRTVDAVAQLQQYLIDGTLHLNAQQLDDALAQERTEERKNEITQLMRISYAGFCLK